MLNKILPKFIQFFLLMHICTSSSLFAQDDSLEDFEDFESELFDDVPSEDNVEDFQGGEIQSNFSAGKSEEELLSLAEKLSYKLTDAEWESAKSNANVVSTYTVQSGDWLFKISKKLFGTGHYYPKIWALNPYITNPHEIEPGMVLVFDSSASGANLSIGNTTTQPSNPVALNGNWQDEKRRLLSQGIQVEYASDDMRKYVEEGSSAGSDGWRAYQPQSYDHLLPKSKQTPQAREEVISQHGQKNSLKQGYSINTFISEKEVESFGRIKNSIHDTVLLDNHNRVFVEFDRGSQQKGDTFSIFRNLDKVSSQNGDREGDKIVIVGHIQLVRRVDDLWEARVYNVLGELRREDQITSYTPKIKRIRKKYTGQKIEAFLIGSYEKNRKYLTLGDLVYLDRGKSDGVRIGHVFGSFGNKDQLLNDTIRDLPLYYQGELTIIGLTDSFATALVTSASAPIKLDSYVRTLSAPYSDKTNIYANERKGYDDEFDGKDDDLDDSFDGSDDLDDFSGDEDFSEQRPDDLDAVSDDDDFDLRDQEVDDDRVLDDNYEEPVPQDSNDEGVDFEGLEAELGDIDDLANGSTGAEAPAIDEEVYDEEVQATDLDVVTEDLESIERQQGKKYLDEDLNEQENPYGLTENDLEEVDELLNFDSIENE